METLALFNVVWIVVCFSALPTPHRTPLPFLREEEREKEREKTINNQMRERVRLLNG